MVVQVGANDLYGDKPPPSRDAYVSAYAALLALIRSKRPAPCVLVCCFARLDCPSYLKPPPPRLQGGWVTAGFKNGDPNGVLQSSTSEAIEQYKRASGDGLVRIITAEEAELVWPDDGGTIEHWNVRGQAKYAQNLRDTMERDGILRELGWDSV